MSRIEFTVPGPAVGKGRPRIGRAGGFSRMFTPAKTVNYETLVAMSAQQAMGGTALLEGACLVDLFIDCQVPSSWSKKKQEQALRHEVLPTTKPDIDNVIKAIFDGINGVVWKDDVQCCSVAVAKRYSATPGVRVKVVPINQLEQTTCGR